MIKEYKVITYDNINELEEYTYFTNKKEAIKHAKEMYDDRTTAVVFDYHGHIIYNSEEDE